MPRVHSFTIVPSLPEALKGLELLAGNMYWSWTPELETLFRRIDGKLWSACGHNPVRLLGAVKQKRLEELAENEGFRYELERAVAKLDAYLHKSTWFRKVCGKNENTSREPIAYFSAEFGIHECLPLYAGGLGILAGDHLKSASDLGVPLVGVGLLYQKGYFRQYLNIDGWQQELYLENDFYNMPIELVRKEDGGALTVSVEYPGRNVLAQIWKVRVGRINLYLLDTNLEANAPADRMITGTLYGGNREMRIMQEIMLGIGGLKALAAMNISPSVCHMNEGHAAFMALERIRELRNGGDMSFDEAAEVAKASNLFTMHTPVRAGLDEFSVELMDKYFEDFIPALGISRKEFLGLGRIDTRNENELFKMPVLALKLSAYRNGVSKLHGEVSRSMWAELWNGVPVKEIPIASITNGVHLESWLSDEMKELYQRYLGPGWSNESGDKEFWNALEQIPDEELWRVHQRYKEQLIVFARNRLKAQMRRRGTYHTELDWAEEVLDPEALTIGFARRFTLYKRGNLILRDPKRLIRMLCDKSRPVQFIFSGKAHPNDTEAKGIIRQLIHFASQYDVRRRIVFLEDYDINVARYLVRGVDVWLNNPRRPMEASGTSGMKAAVNGALNISTLDGWWAEAYTPEKGWAVGAGENYDDLNYQDMIESQAIYNILENEIIPLFYTRSADNLPRPWIRRMKHSMKSITPRFSTNRMLSDYTRRFYNQALARWQHLTAERMTRAKSLSGWKSRIKKDWPGIAIQKVKFYRNNGEGEVEIGQRRQQLKVGGQLKVKALVNLGSMSPQEVSVELYHGDIDAWGIIRDGCTTKMHPLESNGQNGCHWFAGTIACSSAGQRGITVRILPYHTDLADRYELGLVLWESNSSGKNS